MPAYRAFGMVIQCSDAIPALEGVRVDATTCAADLVVETGPPGGRASPSDDHTTWHESVPDDTGQVLRVTRDSVGAFRFLYTDGVRFHIAPDGRTVGMYWPENLTLADAVEYLLGPVIAFVLRMRGVVCLHASAVAAGDECFAVLAPGGHGKSTTAAACARRGLPVLTEDVLALQRRNGRFWAMPGYPRVRLWPEAVEALFGSADALPRLTPDNDTWDKRYLDLNGPGYTFQSEPLPLRTMYTHQREENPSPSFERLSTAEALVTLIGNVYSLSRPEPAQRASEFGFLEQMARSVPVKRYRGRYGIEHLDDHCRALHEDCLGSLCGMATSSR